MSFASVSVMCTIKCGTSAYKRDLVLNVDFKRWCIITKRGHLDVFSVYAVHHRIYTDIIPTSSFRIYI